MTSTRLASLYGVIMPKCIVYTRLDGCVSVCTPSATAMRFMTHGGGRWDGFEPGFVDRQIVAQAENGVGERAARRFVMAMQTGGSTDAEAFEIMRDRFCAHLGTGCELWSTSELPDRWFRNAWRRSHNGGPIGIAMKMARRIQLMRIRAAAERSTAVIQLGRWRDRIRAAATPAELCRVWPQGLTHGA